MISYKTNFNLFDEKLHLLNTNFYFILSKYSITTVYYTILILYFYCAILQIRLLLTITIEIDFPDILAVLGFCYHFMVTIINDGNW